jgi:hypothetical protein
MKTLNQVLTRPTSLLPVALLALCAFLPAQANADEHTSIHCKTTRGGQCEPPPLQSSRS